MCENERSFFSPCQLAKFFPAQKVQKKQSKRCILPRLNCLNIEAYRGTCKSDYSPVLLCHHQTIHLLSPSYTYISNAPQGRAIISLPLLQASQRKKGGIFELLFPYDRENRTFSVSRNFLSPPSPCYKTWPFEHRHLQFFFHSLVGDIFHSNVSRMGSTNSTRPSFASPQKLHRCALAHALDPGSHRAEKLQSVAPIFPVLYLRIRGSLALSSHCAIPPPLS